MLTLGFTTIFFAAFIENLFPPFPGDTVIIYAGFLVGRGDLNGSTLILATLSGSFLSGSLVYWLSHPFLVFLAQKFPSLVSKDKENLFINLMKNYGGLAIFFSRFFVGIRFLGPLLARAGKIPFLVFIFFLYWVL